MEISSNISLEDAFQFVISKHPDSSVVHLDMREAAGDPALATLITEREILFNALASRLGDRDMTRNELDVVMLEVRHRKAELGITD